MYYIFATCNILYSIYFSWEHKTKYLFLPCTLDQSAEFYFDFFYYE